MSARRAFTLIELLVVVSIIALLLAILIPSLSRAREQGKTVKCLSNLQTLAYGWDMYADENGGIILPGRYAKEPGGTQNPANWYWVGNGKKYRPRWVATMGTQIGMFAFREPSTSDDRQDYERPVYRCPKVPQWNDERNYAYGYNHQFLGNARRTNGRFHNFPVPLSRITAPAETVMAGDCLGTAAGFPRNQRRPYNNNGTDFAELGNHGWTLDPPRLTDQSDRGTGDEGSPRTSVDPRHLDKANVIFCDAHGETLTPKRLGYVTDADGRVLDSAPGATNRLFSGRGEDRDPPPLPR